jgi:hypothetical protein
VNLSHEVEWLIERVKKEGPKTPRLFTSRDAVRRQQDRYPRLRRIRTVFAFETRCMAANDSSFHEKEGLGVLF